MENMFFPAASPPWLLTAGVLMQDEDKLATYTGSTSYNYWMGYVNRITN